MKYLLHAIFHAEMVPQQTLVDIRALGFDGIRMDLREESDKLTFAEKVLLVREAGLHPLIIIGHPEQVLWTPADASFHPWVELGNEHDPGGSDPPMTPAAYRLLLREAKFLAERRPHLTLWGGAISNLDHNSLDWLEAVAPDLPSHVSIHRYPKELKFVDPQKGFDTRIHEVNRLRAIIGLRKFGVSEFGYSTAPLRRISWLGSWFPFNSKRLTDAQAAQEIRKEFAFWKNQGAEFATVYQLNDGPGDSRIERYGIRNIHGAWKPQAHTVPGRSLREALAA